MFVYLVPAHDTATVSRYRSLGPLPGFGETSKTLIPLDGIRGGKGLIMCDVEAKAYFINFHSLKGECP